MASVFIKKPHHKQEPKWSCLPACSKMLLSFLGNTFKEGILRSLLGTDENGTSALNILMLNASLSNTKAELHHWLLINLKEYNELFLLAWSETGKIAITIEGR